ncbi:MAG TPA: hypothetical protein VMT49_02975 [Steroidobacteraceae bacterium]|nr:hypothetical protein [Steroidobacteraceae bacterium]
MRAQPGQGGLQRARTLLLEAFASAAAAPGIEAWPHVLHAAAQDGGLALHWRGLLGDAPPAAAVRVAHALEMGPAGLMAWYAAWPARPEQPPLQFAAAVARLVAGHEPLLVLAGPVDAAGGESGALVDADSCARMMVAGFDPDTEVRLGNCAELLESAGDLVQVSGQAESGAVTPQFLILGLKWHAPAGD